MTPLSDALTAAQRSALAALEKAYVAGQLDPPEDTPTAMSAEARLATELHAFGVSDPVDVSFLASALDVLREWGVSAPTMTERVAAENEAASDKQLGFIRKLCEEQNVPEPNKPLTKDQASTVITALQQKSYDAEQWVVPF